jgi:hypothetical protein
MKKSKNEERITVTLSLSVMAYHQLKEIRALTYGNMMLMSTLCAGLLEGVSDLPVTEIKKLLLTSLNDDETAVRHEAVNAAMQKDNR